MIRRVTKYPYNHVSVSLTPIRVYTFARYQGHAVLWRLCARTALCEAGLAKIMVCAVPTRAQHECALNLINEVSKIINITYTTSYAFVPIYQGLYRPRPAASLRWNFSPEFAGAPTRAASALLRPTERFKKYAIFEGPLTSEHAVSDIEDYERKRGCLSMGKTVTNARLFGRFFRAFWAKQ